jgi:hypothetical protein
VQAPEKQSQNADMDTSDGEEDAEGEVEPASEADKAQNPSSKDSYVHRAKASRVIPIFIMLLTSRSSVHTTALDIRGTQIPSPARSCLDGI